MDNEFLVRATIGVINICLLLGLLSVYWASYKKTKSQFAAGLLFFASMFLLKDVFFVLFMIVFPVEASFEAHNGSQGAPFSFLFINIIECVALSILFKITWE